MRSVHGSFGVLALTLCVGMLAGCPDDTGANDSKKKLQATETPAASPTPDLRSERSSPKPSPTPRPYPTPAGLDWTASGSFVVQAPALLAVGPGTGILYCVANPTGDNAPFPLTEYTALGSKIRTINLPALPKGIAFRGSSVYEEMLYTDGAQVYSVDATGSVVSLGITVTPPAGVMVPMAVNDQYNHPPRLAVAQSGKKIARYDLSTPVDLLDFPGDVDVEALGFDGKGNLWAQGGGTLAYFSGSSDDGPATLDVSSLGTILGIAVVPFSSDNSTNDRCWILGTNGLARVNHYYDSQDRLGFENLAGNTTTVVAVTGNRVQVRQTGEPNVVDLSSGTLTRFTFDAKPPASGLKSLQFTPGFVGVATIPNDSAGNMWVGTSQFNFIVRTKF